MRPICRGCASFGLDTDGDRSVEDGVLAGLVVALAWRIGLRTSRRTLDELQFTLTVATFLGIHASAGDNELHRDTCQTFRMSTCILHIELRYNTEQHTFLSFPSGSCVCPRFATCKYDWRSHDFTSIVTIGYC